jgi:hypothetical protein
VSNLQRILNLASKALDKKGSSHSGGSGARSGSTDWRDLVRTAADKVTGTPAAPAAPAPSPAPSHPTPAPSYRAPATPAGAALSAEDRGAIARYDYLLKTADPAQLEQVHREAFARLTPAQRVEVENRLRAELPAYEQPASSSADDLARAATRGEAHKPGFLRGIFAKAAPGAGRGTSQGARTSAGAALGAAGAGAVAGAGLGVAGGLLAAVAGGAIVSSVAAPLLEQAASLGTDFEALSGGLGEFAASGLGEFGTGAEDLAAGAGDAVAGVGEQATGFGEQLSEFGSNFEIPGLGGLGNLFDR